MFCDSARKEGLGQCEMKALTASLAQRVVFRVAAGPQNSAEIPQIRPKSV